MASHRNYDTHGSSISICIYFFNRLYTRIPRPDSCEIKRDTQPPYTAPMSTPSSSFRINLDAAHRSPKRLHHALPPKSIASRTAKMRSSLLFASTLTFTRVNGILSTFTSASTATIVCTETPLPVDCIENSWTGTVYITIPPGCT